MRFSGATFSLNNLPIPAPTLLKEPSVAGNLIPSGATFQFFYPALDSPSIQTLLGYTSPVTLTALWPNVAPFQCSVQVHTAGSAVIGTTVSHRRTLGIGPLGLVQLGYNTYPLDPIPVLNTTTYTYGLQSNQALVVTCTVLQNTLLVTPQFQGLVY